MEVQIISREMIKPSPEAIKNKKPYKLCLFDQLTPMTYAPIIYFYSMNNFSQSTLETLKSSFIKTLNIYYPLAGRFNSNNVYIDRFNEGILMLQAKVNCSFSEFFKFHENESFLNLLLPCQPFAKEKDLNIPIMAMQINLFSCGGIAIGWCVSHKIFDLGTGSAFLSTLTAFCRGDLKGIVKPELDQGPKFFPPRTLFPQEHLSLMESLWFVENKFITRRFVFDEKSIASLKDIAKDENNKMEPSAIETLSCFIWRRAMAASLAISGTSKPSILVEAVNLRTKTNPKMRGSSTGNIFWWATVASNPTESSNKELKEMVSMLNEAIALYKGDYTHSFQGENGYETMYEFCEQLEAIFSVERPDIIAFTSWSKTDFTRPNFGWGEPYFTGLMAKPGPKFRNLTVFIDTKDGKGIEAWITLDEERMEFLKKDPEFIAFASPSPLISSL